jgi:hypothetical protein
VSDFRYVARFECDRTGYLLPKGFSPDDLELDNAEPKWVEVSLGSTSRRAWVNLARAYVVEPLAAEHALQWMPDPRAHPDWFGDDA